jgi:eukaryotic-like serine/threonine-protein kinase
MTGSESLQRGAHDTQRARGPTSAWVGRARETAILCDAVREVAAGRGRLVALAGEPGVGKTRLAEETATYAAANGARVLWGRCWEGGGAPAFWPWIQLIRGSLGGSRWADRIPEHLKPGLARIAQMVPELGSALPSPGAVPAPPADLPFPGAPGSAGPERFLLFDAITGLFKWLAGGTPLMMVLDDVHAADEDSLVLLRFLARELRQIRALIVATYRESEVRESAAHAALLSEIGREGTTIPLRGLSLDEVAEFIRGAGGLPADRETVSSLHQATDGNPFFLDEIVRLISAERDQGHADRPIRGFTIPDSIRTTIRRRLRPLTDRTKDLLTTASVIGREFDGALLQAVSGLPGEQLFESLAEAAAGALVIEPEGDSDRYRFAHAIIAEVLRAELGRTARLQLHQQIAAALERVHGDDLTPHLAELAHHCIQSLPIAGADRALEYSWRGAESARSQLAFAEAARLYAMVLRALAALPRPDEVQRCETLLAMGEAQARGESLDQARAAFEQAADVARRLGHSTLLARTALHLSAWFGTFFTHDRPLIALVEEALAAVDGGDSAVRASLMAILAGERYWSGDRESAFALSDDAVAMAQRLGDTRALVSALWVRCQIRWGPENVEERLGRATEIASMAEAIGDHQRALRAHEMRFTALLEMGDMRGVAAEVRAYEVLARQAGEQFGIVERFDAALALLRGDFEQAAREAQVVSRLAQQRQDPALVACAQELSGLLAEEQGRLEPAQIALAAEALISQSPALGVRYRVIMAFVNAMSGQQVEAAAELEALACDECAVIARDWNWLDNMRCLALLCLALRDVRHAAIVYTLLLPYADRNITTGWGDVARGSMALYLGSLARMMGRLDEAEAHLELALRLNRRMGARPSVARTQFEYARVAAARNRAGDHEQALRLLRESLATASELGMNFLLQRARVLLSRVGGGEDASAFGRPGAGSLDAIAAAGAAEWHALGAHTAPDGTLTILFSDVVESTALFEELGDLRAKAILDEHNAIVRHHVAIQRGVEIKSTGDGFMVVFSSARRALLCAIGIQRSLAANAERESAPAVRVRIGLHVGEPVNVSTDLSGKAVIVAARIASTAGGGEILVSSTVRELTESAGDLRFREAGEVELKGLSGTFHLYRAIW